MLNEKNFNNYGPVSLMLVGKKIYAVRSVMEVQECSIKEARKVCDHLQLRFKLPGYQKIIDKNANKDKKGGKIEEK